MEVIDVGSNILLGCVLATALVSHCQIAGLEVQGPTCNGA